MEHGLTTQEIVAIAAKLRTSEPLTPAEAGHTAYTLELLDREYRDVVNKLHKAVERFKIPAQPGRNVDDALLAEIERLQAIADAAGDAIAYTREWMRAPLNIEGHKEAARRLRDVQAQIDALAGMKGEGDARADGADGAFSKAIDESHTIL